MPAPFTIRPFAESDAEALASLYVASVSALGPRDYSAEQVAAWLSRAPAEMLRQRAAGGSLVLVAADIEGRPVGFADLGPDGHIGFLYCAPKVAGRGIGSALCDALEAAARSQKLKRVYSEASEGARRLFLKKGFKVTARRDFEVDGIPIHNYAVEKIIEKSGQG